MKFDFFKLWVPIVTLSSILGASGCVGTGRAVSDPLASTAANSRMTVRSGTVNSPALPKAADGLDVTAAPLPSATAETEAERGLTVAVDQVRFVSGESVLVQSTTTGTQADSRIRLTSLHREHTSPEMLPADPSASQPAGFDQPQITNPLSPEADETDVATVMLDLPMALSMVGGQHPAVGFARWRVQEAYAQLNRAQVLWLPSIQSGFSFNRHDGNLQNSDGFILDVNRNSFQYGLGAGAVGAGTTQRPGVIAQFHRADSYFLPNIAERNAWARSHAANATVNAQLLQVAVSYLDLLDAGQELSILADTRAKSVALSKLTRDFADSGQGLQADADRMQTELLLAEGRLSAARERTEVAAVRLAQALSLDAGQSIVPLDTAVVPIEMVALEQDRPQLIGTGLHNRPELKEAKALVSAACEQYKRQKYAPFVPSVLLGFTAGGFGGGLGNSLGNVASRYDFDALASWEIRNLGLGERHARREATAQIQQAKFEQVRVMDRVAREISEAHARVNHSRQRIAITEQTIRVAEDSYTRNLSRIRNGQGLPLEVLQSLEALEEARRAYLAAVVDFNEAQFRLQWSLGWPVSPHTES
jgi:outer membrane protein TolC